MIKILLLEDDSALSSGIEYALMEEGYSVTPADHIKKAKEIYASSDFDLLILDIMLPDGTGYEFCKYVRNFSDVPVIFLTALDQEVNVIMGLDMGGDDYITKPFRIKELVSRIKAVLRRKSDKRSIVSAGNVIIEVEKQKVTVDGYEISLSPQELKLLILLIKNKGNIVTREIILEKLWDIDESYIDDNTLSVYIRRLREKIENDPANPLHIKTVRGLGYRWE